MSSIPKVNFGTSKLVVHGPFTQGSIQVNSNQVLIVTTRSELTHESQTIKELVSTRGAWTHLEKKRLKQYCFTELPSHYTSVSTTTFNWLQRHYGNQPGCATILKQSNLVYVIVKKYKPVCHYSIVDILFDIHTQLFSIQKVKKAIAWVLLDTILALSLLSSDGMAHCDFKLNNLVYDDMTKRFKVTDFGYTTSFDTIAFENRIGTIHYPWFHPYFQAIHSMSNTSKKNIIRLKHAGLVDRFAFVGFVFQIKRALCASRLLPKEYYTTLHYDMLSLLASMKGQSPSQTFECQSTKWNKINRAVFVEQKAFGAVEWCDIIHEYQLYSIGSWNQLFKQVVRWAWSSNVPRSLVSLSSFIASKKHGRKREKRKRT